MKINEEKLYEKIAEVVSFVCNNPAVFVSEIDIHVLMMKSLMEIDCFNPFAVWKKGLRKTNCTIGKKSEEAKPSKEKYRTMLVHKEYGNNRGRKERSDIGIFDKKDIESIDDPLNLKRGKKYLEPKYIFEFGTEKSAGSKKDYEKHFKGDFRKLSKSRNAGFLIHIQRIYIKSGSDTKTFKDNRTKHKHNQDITVDIWNDIKNKDRIKVLIFFVDIGGKKRVVKEKVRMFNPYPANNDSDDWKAVNLGDIEKIIKNLLKKDKPDIEKNKNIQNSSLYSWRESLWER